jgi:hypothetical protein
METKTTVLQMVANPVMIDAYKASVPGNGKPFPDGSKIAKIEWKPKKMTEAPYLSAGSRYLARRILYREGQQEIPGHEGMGIRRIRLQSRVRDVHTRCDRNRQLRVRVPHDCRVTRLHLPLLPKAVSGLSIGSSERANSGQPSLWRPRCDDRGCAAGPSPRARSSPRANIRRLSRKRGSTARRRAMKAPVCKDGPD